jgi:hypothetical protein
VCNSTNGKNKNNIPVINPEEKWTNGSHKCRQEELSRRVLMKFKEKYGKDSYGS